MSVVEKYRNKLNQNLGLINLFGKSFGRVLFLVLLSYLSIKLSVKEFADFAIIWSSLRLFTFYSANNLYIIYFDKVRNFLINKAQWPRRVSANIIITCLFFSIIFFVASLFLFEELWVALIFIPCLLCYVIIRNLSEFAKADNNLFLSIFIEDFMFYLLFFISSLIGLAYFNNIFAVMVALAISLVITTVVCLMLFKRKFKIEIRSYSIGMNDFSVKDFYLGFNYTILRGNEVLSNFGMRYLGQIYFGDLFVAYAHIMYQFYNVFSLLTVSVISGFQSKITIRASQTMTKAFFMKMYKKMLLTIAPFILALLVVFIVLSDELLLWFFPKYSEYGLLLIKVSLAGVLFTFVQPFIFVLIYNKLFSNIHKLNYIQYVVMALVFTIPLFLPVINEQFWLLLVLTIFVVIQGLFALFNYNKLK